jgi:PAS domain S-box-containing protein
MARANGSDTGQQAKSPLASEVSPLPHPARAASQPEARSSWEGAGLEPQHSLREMLAGLADPLGLLEGMFTHSPVPYSIFRADGGCLLTNPAYREMFGREPPSTYNIFQDEVAERQGLSALLRRAFQGEIVETPVVWYDPKELQHVHVTGTRRVAISCTCFPLMGQGGEVRHVVIAYRDRTAEWTSRDAEKERLQQLMEELAAERARLKAVLDNIPAGVLLAEAPSGRIVLGNAQVERLLGHPVLHSSSVDQYDEWVGFHPDGRRVEGHEWPLARALQGETVPGEDFLYQRGDGTREWIRVGGAPIRRDGHITGGVVAIYDIQHEKRAQGRLRALADTSTVLAQASTDFSEALEELARLASEALGECCVLTLVDEEKHALDVVATYHPDPQARQLLKDSLNASYENEGGSAMRVARAGRPLLVARVPQEGLLESLAPPERPFTARYGLHSVLVVPLRAQGTVIGTMGVSRGQPGRPYTQEDQDFLQEMADRAGLVIQNVRLLRTAQQAVRLRDDFLSIASHELKTPLTPLSLKLQIMSRMVGSEQGEALSQRLSRDVEAMRRQVKRLSDLISDLLDVARISGGRLKLALEQVELTGLVREVASRFELEAERAGGKLGVRVAEPLVGRWDRLRLEQVVTNLLSNALKYGPGKPITVQVEGAGEQARLTVRDEGIGIEPQHLARIFEKFERAASERHYGGLGLGLYITRQIVKALGGSITVESVLQQGTVFTVQLPLRGPSEPA